MSRAFVKEDSQQEPIRIPPRASLPGGATNYVTPQGLKQLHQEKEALETEKAQLALDDEDELRRQITFLNGKLQLLQDRIDSARKIDPQAQPQDEVRFGATVTLELQDAHKTRQFQIVGVDEADFEKQKISFLSPIAQALSGSKAGDIATLELGKEERSFKVLEITY
ncbi:MAG TPA: GreA/GreB family elongation factor [Fodinibius sp.]|nr:GreA/GreB family elongation factor [Fodinibius sp.]